MDRLLSPLPLNNPLGMPPPSLVPAPLPLPLHSQLCAFGPPVRPAASWLGCAAESGRPMLGRWQAPQQAALPGSQAAHGEASAARLGLWASLVPPAWAALLSPCTGQQRLSLDTCTRSAMPAKSIQTACTLLLPGPCRPTIRGFPLRAAAPLIPPAPLTPFPMRWRCPCTAGGGTTCVRLTWVGWTSAEQW